MLSKMKSADVVSECNDNAHESPEETTATFRRTEQNASTAIDESKDSTDSHTDRYPEFYPGQESDNCPAMPRIRIAVLPSGEWEVIGNMRVSLMDIDMSTLEDLTEGHTTTDELLEAFKEEEHTIPYMRAACAHWECEQ